ncbi:MAG: type II toxin-antitoxin system death-on-curing family toxin [Coriobacteriales bacterium]|jgi:death-on-curing protein|nr:type II toxin-antitoxin system death-on-curing family toxin [Coriobacteriales bacterium]
MMQTIAYEGVLAIHEVQIANHGGLSGIRDEGLLDSALTQPFVTFDGIDLYPSIEEKAARYAYGIIKNHPFADGNKRTGAALMMAFLRLSGLRFKPRHKDLEQTILDVASGAATYDTLVAFVRANISS